MFELTIQSYCNYSWSKCQEEVKMQLISAFYIFLIIYNVCILDPLGIL